MLWTRWFVGQLEKAYKGDGKAYMPKSLNSITGKPSIAVCIIWVEAAFTKMKKKKSMFKKKAVDLYMAGEVAEMALLIDDHQITLESSSRAIILLLGLRNEILSHHITFAQDFSLKILKFHPKFSKIFPGGFAPGPPKYFP